MTEENKKDKLKRMRERLYTKGFKPKSLEIGRFKKKKYEVSEEWEEPVIVEPVKKRKIKTQKKISMVKKVFIASAVFFVLALIFAAVTFYRGGNIISADSVDMAVDAPVSVNGGEEFTVSVDIKNKSEVSIESANILVKYPKGSYKTADSQDELSRERFSLDVISPGESVSKTFPLTLFGEENSEKEVVVKLELRFKGSSATFEKTELYKVRLSSSPVNLTFSLPKEVSLKQEFEAVVDLKSNSKNVIKGLLLQVDYPFGFVFTGATPAPVSGDNVWDIGDLAASDSRKIIIRGTMDGQEGDEKIFNASTGIKIKEEKNKIGTVYNFVSESITVTKPFLGVRLLLNGSNTPEYVSLSNKSIRADVLWESNIPTRIIDGQIEVKIKGDVLDKFSVLTSNNGFYRSIDNTIIWDKGSNRDLAVIEPGESGSMSFTLQSLPLVKSGVGAFQKPQIVIEVSAKGKRISDSNVPEEIVTSVSKKIKFESNLKLASRAVYYTGPFKNSGPLPPVAEKNTTYTIIWTVVNSSNNVTGAKVKTTLPAYVKWLGVVSPNNENITFNDAGGEIVWDVGDVESGTGVVSSPREVAFQVSFLPSISQVGKTPLLTEEIILTGDDTFTKTNIGDKARGLSTRLSTDPYFKVNQASVTY